MSFELVYSIIVPTVTLAALLYAGIEDILYREVRREIIWILMVIVGLVMDTLYVINAEDQNHALLLILITVVLGFLIGFILFYLGVWGGADTKALWALSILTPVNPLTNNLVNIALPDLLIVNIIDSMVFSLLLNAGLIAVFYPLILMVVNTISASKESLFIEVRGTSSQKFRCFFFGYKKNVSKINEKKLHFDFLEEFSDKEFSGNFEGNFEGRLDGKFLGIFDGELIGEFTGKAIGVIQLTDTENFEQLTFDTAITKAEQLTKTLALRKDDEAVTALLTNYRRTFVGTEDITLESNEYIINIDGRLTTPIKGCFTGTLEGIFEGKLSGKMIGKLSGDFEGQSSKGKMNGSTIKNSQDWQLNIRMGLDEDEVMEQRQLRTLWQLRKQGKKSVWVTPGIPFVSLMFFGYIQYLLFGNIALLLFNL